MDNLMKPHIYMCIPPNPLSSPKERSSQMTTRITTTTFRMVLILRSIGR